MRLVYGLYTASLEGGTVETFTQEAAVHVGCDSSEVVLYAMDPVSPGGDDGPGRLAGAPDGLAGGNGGLSLSPALPSVGDQDQAGEQDACASSNEVGRSTLYCIVAPGNKRLTVSRLANTLHTHQALFNSLCTPENHRSQQAFAEAVGLAESLRVTCEGLLAANRKAVEVLRSVQRALTAETLRHVGVRALAGSSASGRPVPAKRLQKLGADRAKSPTKVSSAPVPSRGPSDLLGRFPRSERQAVNALLEESSPYTDKQVLARKAAVQERVEAYAESYRKICQRLEELMKRPAPLLRSEVEEVGESAAGV